MVELSPLCPVAPSPKAPFRKNASANFLGGILCLLTSLGLHSLALWLPIPFQREIQEVEAEKTTSESLPVTVLPATKPRSTPQPSTPPPPVPRSPSPTPTVSASPLLETLPASPPEAKQQSAAPIPAENPELLPKPTAPAPPIAESESPEPTPYADFPHLSEDTTECEERTNCWRGQTINGWRSAMSALEENLVGQGYELVPVTEETGISVYAVEKEGETEYYLNLASTLEGGILYALTEQPMTPEELSDMRF